MDWETRKLINNLAEEIINQFNIKVPIKDINFVVKSLNGIIKEDINLLGEMDGYIHRIINNKYRFEIVISPFQSETRKNFTVAHELGHLFLHMGYMIDENVWNRQNIVYTRSGNSELEYEANEFAGALLMPKEEYYRVMQENTNGKTVYTSRLAEHFNVSVDAAANRGKFLGYLQW